jgi:predicted nucleic acid-binding protein
LIRYLDTSLLVAAYTTEPRTPSIQTWLGEQAADELAISDWVVTEFSAALSIKLRTGQLDEETRAEALTLFTRFCTETVSILPISGLHFRIAARFADQHTPGLRAADALHLAICADHGASLYTLDRRLADAGAALGCQAILL